MASQSTPLRLLAQLTSAGQSRVDLLKRLSQRSRLLGSTFFARYVLLLKKRLISPRASAVALGLSLILVLPAVFVVPALVVSALAAGLFVGLASLWSLTPSNVERLLDTATLNRLVNFHFDGKRLTASVHATMPRVIEGGVSGRLLTAALASLASAIVLVGNWRVAFDVSGRPHLLSIAGISITPLVVSLVFLDQRHEQRLLMWYFRRRLDVLVRAANCELQCIRQIDGVTVAIEAVCKLFNVSPPTDYRNTIARFIAGNCASIVLDPGWAAGYIQAVDELARHDLAELTDLLAVHEALQTSGLLAATAVEESRNPLFETQLEGVSAQASALSSLISQRRWNDYRDASKNTIEQLKQLREQARRRREPAAVLAPGTDAHHILGIEAGMPVSEVRRLRTRLALIYHPDAPDGFANSGKMAEINAAYDAVMAQRKQK